MSISIATRGYFTPSVGTGVIRATGGGTGFVPQVPPLPVVYVIDVDDREFEFPLVHINGVNSNDDI